MKKQFIFSIVMAVYNVEKYIDESINSILNQTLDFKDNIQIILVDDESSDNSFEICKTYENKYPNNIIALTKTNNGPASARNLGLKYVTGKYVNFLDPDDYLTKNTLKNILSFFKKHDEIDFVSIPMIYFESEEGDHPLNYKFKDKNKVVNLLENPEYIQLSSSSAFFKSNVIKKYKFNEKSVRSEDAYIINRILLENPQYGLLNSSKYFYRRRYSNSSVTNAAKQKKEFYTDFLKDYCLDLIKHSLKKYGTIPKFIQYLLIYDIKPIIYSEGLTHILNAEEQEEFWVYLRNVLNYIDINIIKNHLNLNNYAKSFLIYCKNDDFHIVNRPNKNKVFLKSNDFIINKLHNHNIWIDIIEIKENCLNISGLYVSCSFNETINIECLVETNNDNFIAKSKFKEYTNTYRETQKFLDVDWKFYHSFDLQIPLNPLENYILRFRVTYNEDGNKTYFYPKIKFKEYCNINNLSNYFNYLHKTLIFKNNSLHITSTSLTDKLKLELKSIFMILTSSERYRFYSLFIRLIYFITLPKYKNKKIWLFMDRPNIADDNAMHLFKYAISQVDSFEKFFIVDKKSEDYKKMLKISKNIVPFGSLKHKLLYLYSEKIISSHVDHQWLNPFYYYNEKLYAGLSTIQTCFLQHGVIKDDLSGWLRKFYHNFQLFVTVSNYERDSILNGNYNYSEDVVQLLGLPRYDNLKNINNKKQILFMPTWRSNLTKDNFNNSIYFLRLNSLLNNKRLMEILKKNDYNFIFKPHYNLLEYIDLFDIPNEIQVSTETPYQELFNNASLMITDYSSVFFDFAYIKKPVIYYQNDDYHYEKGYFDYETMGFGDIIQTEDKLIDKIIEYIENNCQMEEKYKKRVDKFFKYKDKNNSKRVYEWLLEH